jgi:HK97 family phage prohead protease
MGHIYDYKAIELSFKDIDQKQGIVTGYFSAFNKPDAHKDVIRPGAFTKSIAENGPASTRPRIKHLLNHDIDRPIGKLLVLQEDNYGLYYESKIGTNQAAKDFMAMVESDLVHEHSIGFQIKKYNKIADFETTKEGDAAFELTELKLYEGSSLTAWGANEYTPLTGVKSFVSDPEKLAKRIKSIEAFCRNSDASDDAIELLLIEVKQLYSLVEHMQEKSTLPDEESTKPEVKQHGIDFNRLALRLLEK